MVFAGYFSCLVEGVLYVQKVDLGRVTTNYVGSFSDSPLQLSELPYQTVSEDVRMLSMMAFDKWTDRCLLS